MKTARLRITMLGWWHTGSGHTGGGQMDAVALRDEDDLPCLPGRTLKGLLREAVQQLEDFEELGSGTTDKLFGRLNPKNELNDNEKQGGELRFINASLEGGASAWLRSFDEPARGQKITGLFGTVASTAMENGVAKDKTLRVTEVAIPVVLETEVSGPDSDWDQALGTACKLVRGLGSHRHRGLGRCKFELLEAAKTEAKSATALPISEAMDERACWLKVTLLSELVVSARGGATLGHESLDYLPGSLFLGAVAGAFARAKQFDPALFLGGRLRFGWGQPFVEGSGLALPIPLAWHTIKHDDTKTVHNGLVTQDGHWDELSKPDATGEPRQPKQLRDDYVTCDGKPARVEVPTTQGMKTAIDREKHGRSKDRQLFGYEAVRPGAVFALRVSADPATVRAEEFERVIRVLTSGEVALGRSRSAEYARVRIEAIVAPPVPRPIVNPTDAHIVSIYLASDMALFRDGQPTLTPQPEDFKLSAVTKLLAERTYLRVRQYSPWNAFHQGRETERQLLVKGGVVTFWSEREWTKESLEELQADLSDGVGPFRSEGFGQVLVNPEFALRSGFQLTEKPHALAPATAKAKQEVAASQDSPLKSLLKTRAQAAAVERAAEELGRQWAEALIPAPDQAHPKIPNKSQWSQIRQLADTCHRDKKRTLSTNLKNHCMGSTTRKGKWGAEFRRDVTFLGFLDARLSDAAKLGVNPERALYHAACLIARRLGGRDR